MSKIDRFVFCAICFILPLALYILKSDMQELRTLYSATDQDLQAQVYELQEQIAIAQETSDIRGVVVTYYCDCEICTGQYTSTKTGTTPIAGYTIAVDPKYIPLGSRVYIENIGWRIAEDVGGAVKGNHIDVFTATHEEATRGGRHTAFAIVREE